MSQGLSAIAESPQTDLPKLLKQASASPDTFPKLLILEMSIEKLNPYELCRWVQEFYPQLKVILTAQERTHVSEIEQKWAKNQGAYELLAGFDPAALQSSLSQAMESVMLALGKTDWELDSLVPIIEELIQEIGQVEEKNTLIQEPDTLIQNGVSQKPEKEPATNGASKRQGVKLKPKVKRFRGLTY